MFKKIFVVLVVVLIAAAGYYFYKQYFVGPVEELKVTSIQFGMN